MGRLVFQLLVMSCSAWHYGISSVYNSTWCNQTWTTSGTIPLLRDESWCESCNGCVRIIEDNTRCNRNLSLEEYSDCDEIEDCFSGSQLQGHHLELSSNNMSQCFRCLGSTSKVMLEDLICDGIIDCPDLSDECLCTRRLEDFSVCDNIHWQSESTTSKIFQCETGDGRITNFPLNKICDGTPECNGGIDENFCRVQDGVILKKEMNWECCKPRKDENVTAIIPEAFRGCPSTYRGFQKCDGVTDCESVSDECFDECFEDNIFSDKESLVSRNKSGYLLGISGAISVIAVIGNFIAITFTCWKFRKRRRMTKGQLLTKTLFLSLSISDSLVAIYTAMIWAEATSTKLGSEYCRYDSEWRSGHKCHLLGCLFVIGSEQSVFTLVLITLTRVLAIRRPFSTPPVRAVMRGLALCWIFSIALAVIPLISLLEDTFIMRIVRFDKNDIMIRHIEAKDISNLTHILLMGSKDHSYGQAAGKIGTWARLFFLMEHKLNMSTSSENTRRFGYYSVHSVCLPQLLPNPEDRTWFYSFFILLINFLAFCFMVLGYFVLYRGRKLTERTSVRLHGPEKQVSSKIKRKITLILLTDLLCWIPVCVMGFLKCAGVTIPNGVYLVAAFVILPLNSAVNPFLYTVSPKYLRKVIPKKKVRSQDRLLERMTMEMNLTNAVDSSMRSLK